MQEEARGEPQPLLYKKNTWSPPGRAPSEGAAAPGASKGGGMLGLGATRGWDVGAGGARPRRVVQSPSLHPLLLPAQHWETGSSCPSITGTTGGDKAAAGQLLGNWATSLKLF